ncbi:hypothetical protein BCR44DRAFT_1427192 [Catenaria anguillulae PL171]|uniref:Uncharacterized protein n=1 Tax=Catenaria anguillulae PL171 TaxID=765915 RepID=A0A1Y2HX06_9FUNG|nr:hypothetical protein BCR44DRAFT_1427192 [Catenaria anguillulae PL171]
MALLLQPTAAAAAPRVSSLNPRPPRLLLSLRPRLRHRPRPHPPPFKVAASNRISCHVSYTCHSPTRARFALLLTNKIPSPETTYFRCDKSLETRTSQSC